MPIVFFYFIGSVTVGMSGQPTAERIAVVIGLVQIAFAMISGAFLFKVDWGPHVRMVVLVLCVYATLAALAGMLLGNFGRSEG